MSSLFLLQCILGFPLLFSFLLWPPSFWWGAESLQLLFRYHFIPFTLIRGPGTGLPAPLPGSQAAGLGLSRLVRLYLPSRGVEQTISLTPNAPRTPGQACLPGERFSPDLFTASRLYWHQPAPWRFLCLHPFWAVLILGSEEARRVNLDPISVVGGRTVSV